MADIKFIIENIKAKTERIVEKSKGLTIENKTLNSKIAELEQLLILQREAIKDLEEKNKMLKIANSISMDKNNKRVLKLKINKFIREIDKSMSLLND